MRNDAEARVTGELRFVLDRTYPGMVHAAGVRSARPHAQIVSVDASQALALPGVLAVLTGEGVPERSDPRLRFGESVADQPILARDIVSYAGELVALVVAERQDQARAAAQAVVVEYEDLPFVVDALEALQSDAPAVHEATPDNRCADWSMTVGDLGEGWRTADRVYEADYYSPPASQVPLEPHVALARWEQGKLTVDTSTQAPWLVASVLARAFDLDAADVRVVSGNLGGAFGSKVDAKIEPVAAYAARQLDRPVRYELTREEVYYTVCKHAAHVSIRTGVTNEGILCARDVSVVWNSGAYATSTPDATGSGMIRSLGPYRIPHARLHSVAAYTHSVPSGPFRGAMTSQLTWAYESQLDDIAADLGLSSFEIRRRNVLVDGDVYLDGKPAHDMKYVEMLDDLEAAGRQFGADSAAKPGMVRGVGIALMIKTTLTPSRSEARVVLQADDTADVYTSAVEMGQGAVRALRNIAAAELDLDLDAVRLETPDTALTPFDSMSASSRTTFSVGEAIADACAKIRVERAESRAEPVEALGVYQSRGGLAALENPELGDVTAHWHQGGVVVEVEIDTDTGQLRVTKSHAVCYAGRVISPDDVQRQIEGCVIFGLGPTLYEELVLEEGRPANPNFAGYLIPSPAEIPRVLSTCALEGDDAEIHGIAEMNVPVIAPAVGNAVKNAIGHRFTRLPIRAEDVYRVLVRPWPLYEEE